MKKNYLQAAFALMAAIFSATSANAQDWNIMPKGGNIPGPIKEVTLTFEGASDLSFSNRALLYYDPTDGADNSGIIYFGGDEYSQERDTYSASINGNTVTFKVKANNGVWDLKGKYDLRIPSGAIKYTYNGQQSSCPFINVIWYISDFPNLIASPAPGEVADLSKFKISLPEGFVISSSYLAMPAQYGPRVYKADEWGNPTGNLLAYYKLPEGIVATDIKGKSMVEFAGPYYSGSSSVWTPVAGEKYVIQVPKSSLTIKNSAKGTTEFCPKSEFVYTIKNSTINTGVDTIAEAKTYNVVTLDGRVIAIDAPSEILNSLAPGYYIINGTVVLIK